VVAKLGDDDVDSVSGDLDAALGMARAVVDRTEADAVYPEVFGNTLFAFYGLQAYDGH
jgi:hypothetical protein